MANKESRAEYEEYFKEVWDALDAEFEGSKEYSEIINNEIAKFKDFSGSKGGQHYLIEHVKNAVALQSQRQSIIKDKFTMKKTILDFTFKEGDEGSDQNLFKELTKLVENSKTKIAKSNAAHKEVAEEITKTQDNEIDEILGDYPKEDDE